MTDDMNSPCKQATGLLCPEMMLQSSTLPQSIVGPSIERLMENSVQYLKDVKDFFSDTPNKYDMFLQVMKEYKDQRIPTADLIVRIMEFFEGNQDLTLGFNKFLPKGYNIAFDEESHPQKPVQYDEALNFVNKIKMRSQGGESGDQLYKSLLDIMNVYRRNNKAITDVYQEISALFSEHPDLLSEFRRFSPDSSSTVLLALDKSSLVSCDVSSTLVSARQLHGQKKVISSHIERDLSTDSHDVDIYRPRAGNELVVGNERDSREREYDRYFDHSGLHISQKRKASCVVEEHVGEQFAEEDNCLYGLSRSLKIEDRDRHSDRKRTVTDRECGSERAVDLDTSRWSTRNMSSYSSGKDEYISEPIRELDVSTWERCTPSYCLLPKDYQIPVASQEGETGAEVLNDQCVLASYDSGDVHKNKDEEVMFNCENDRYELDMLLAHAASATKRVEELLKKIADNLVEVDNTFHINDHLTVTDRKCIKRIYGEYGPAILDVLEEDAPLALPMILSRLKQKQEEWAHACIEYNKVWAGVYATYHQKLLNCKQQDAKSLTAKGEQKRSIN